MSLEPPPIYQPIVTDDSGVIPLPWIKCFDQFFRGDSGTSWTPLFTNLAVTGAAPTITGIYYKLSQGISLFRIKIVPGTDTSSTAGSTYCNFPLTMAGDGFCIAVSGLLSGNPGMCDQASNRIYVPTWSAVTVPLSIIGIVEAK